MSAEASHGPLTAPIAPRTWRVRDLVVGVGLLAAVFVLVVAGIGIVDASARAGDGPSNAAGVVAAIVLELLIGGIVLFLMWWRGLRLRDLGFVRPRRWGPIVSAWIGAYIALGLYGATLLLLDALGVDVSWLKGGNPAPVGAGLSVELIILLGVAVVLMAPISEELFFRALLFRGLRSRWQLLPALALSGALFGAFHVNIAVLIPFSLVGALFAWANEQSGSTWTSVLAHAGFNGVSFAVTVIIEVGDFDPA